MNATALRVSVWFFALVAVYMFVPVYQIIDAVLLFCAAGVVPGTDIVLTPGQTLWTLGALGAACMLLIFHREIIRAFRRRPQATMDAVHEAVTAATQPLLPPTRKPAGRLSGLFARKPKVHVAHHKPVAPKPVVIVVIPGRVGLIPRVWQSVRATAAGYTLQFARWLRFSSALLAYNSQESVLYIRRHIAILLRASQRRTASAARTVWRFTVIRWRQARRLSALYVRLTGVFLRKSWLKAVPHLERFDRYLEMKFKQSEPGKAILRAGREIKLLVLAWRQQLDALLGRPSSKD